MRIGSLYFRKYSCFAIGRKPTSLMRSITSFADTATSFVRSTTSFATCCNIVCVRKRTMMLTFGQMMLCPADTSYDHQPCWWLALPPWGIPHAEPIGSSNNPPLAVVALPPQMWQLFLSLPCVKGGGTACRDGGIVLFCFATSTIPQSLRDRANCQASATLKNASKGDFHPKHFLGLKLIDRTTFCKVSLSKE